MGRSERVKAERAAGPRHEPEPPRVATGCRAWDQLPGRVRALLEADLTGMTTAVGSSARKGRDVDGVGQRWARAILAHAVRLGERLAEERAAGVEPSDDEQEPVS